MAEEQVQPTEATGTPEPGILDRVKSLWNSLTTAPEPPAFLKNIVGGSGGIPESQAAPHIPVEPILRGLERGIEGGVRGAEEAATKGAEHLRPEVKTPEQIRIEENTKRVEQERIMREGKPGTTIPSTLSPEQRAITMEDVQKMFPDLRPRKVDEPIVKPFTMDLTGEKPARTPGNPHELFYTPKGAMEIQFNKITDGNDLADAFKEVRDLTPKPQPKEVYKGTPLESPDDVARTLGIAPEILRNIQERLSETLYLKQVKTLLTMTEENMRQMTDLAAEYRNRPNVDTAQKFLDQLAIQGEVSNGLERGFNGNSEFGKGIKMYEIDPKSGEINYRNVNRGTASPLTSGLMEDGKMDINRLMDWFETDPEAMRYAAAQLIERPTGRQAMIELLLSGRLASLRTPVHVFSQGIQNLMVKPLERLGGALDAKIRGYSGQAEAPVFQEVGEMYRAYAQSFPEMLRVFAKTLRTGETQYTVGGNFASELMGRTGAKPSELKFRREAFPRLAGTIDTAGSMVGIDNAGNVLTGLGKLMELAGHRGLVAAHEATSFVSERVNMYAMARRAATHEGLDGLQAASFIEEFVNHPPEYALAEVKYQKPVDNFMNSLYDDGRSGFQGLRTISAKLNESLNEIQSPWIRMLAPFVKASANVATRALEYSAGINVLSPSFDRMLMSADPIIRSTAAGKLFVSSGIALTGISLGAMGVIRGALTTDPKMKEMLTQAGTPPNSITMLGVTVPLNPASPIGFPLLVWATMGNLVGRITPDLEVSGMELALHVGLEFLNHETLLGPLGHITQAIEEKRLSAQLEKQGSVEIGLHFLDEIFLKPFVPLREIQDIDAAWDPYRRVYDKWIQEVASRTPGFSPNLPQETDMLGNPRLRGGGMTDNMMNSVQQLVFPGGPNVLPQDELSQKLVEKGITIHDPQAHITINGTSIPLEKSEVQFVKNIMNDPQYGPTLKQTIEQITKSSIWKDLTAGKEGEAQAIIQQIVQQYVQRAKMMYFANNHHVQERFYSKAQEGMNANFGH